MTFTVANTEVTNTFDYWRSRTNELAYNLTNTVVTVGGNTANGIAVITGTVIVNNSAANAIIGYNVTNQTIAEFVTNSNTYNQVVHRNVNTGVGSSADFVVYNDSWTGNADKWVNLGIVSSKYSNTAWTIGGANDAYLYTGNSNLSIGANGSNYVNFFTGGTLAANERMRITASGNVGIGATSPDATLRVTGSANVSGLLTTGTLSTSQANVSGSLAVVGTLYANISGTFSGTFGSNTVSISNTTDSTSISTGSLTTTGGVGIAKNLYANGASATAYLNNLNVAGTVTGNGSGLTSVSYISTSSYATDQSIFVGGDSGVWKTAAGRPQFYPTIPNNVTTLTVGVQLDLFVKAVADTLSASSDITAGQGNPQLRFRIVKGPANTALYTSEYSVLSTAGSGGGYITEAIDTTPTAGNTIPYEIQYWWRSGAADPNANAGTITVSATNTPTVTGTGTYFGGTLNPRMQIASSANPTTWKNISYILGSGSLTLEANWGTNNPTSSTYVVNDPYANCVIDQTNLNFTFVGYK
jgi:hypothetical protein